MPMDSTTWPETFGNGAAIGIDLITMRHLQAKAEWRATRKARTRHLIRLSLTRRSASIAAGRFFATNNIARATSSAHAAKAKSTPAPIIWAFVASNHLHGRRRSDQLRCSLNRLCSSGLIDVGLKSYFQL